MQYRKSSIKNLKGEPKDLTEVSSFPIEPTGKTCVKCGGEIIMRYSHRFPFDAIIECLKCKKKYKLEVA